MDMYKIICPYCDCEHVPRDYEEGFQAVVCFECNKPFVNQTTMTPVFVSYALVGVGQETPTPEEVEQDILVRQNIIKNYERWLPRKVTA